MPTPDQILRYWRNSLADAARINLDIGKLGEPFIVPRPEVASGHLTSSITDKIFGKAVNSPPANREKRFDGKEGPVPILISPVNMRLKAYHGARADDWSKTLTPLWIPALLTKTGDLLPKKDGFSWIARNVLEPTDWSEITIGSVDTLDEFLTNSEVPDDSAGWGKLWDFCIKMLEAVAGSPVEEFAVPNYEKVPEALIFAETVNQGSSQHIWNLYDRIIKSQRVPRLLKSLTSTADAELKPLLGELERIQSSMTHLGQMDSEHPCSESQRESILHLLSLPEGEMLAVNGPPGTGKTTLLQSVTATLWVQAAVAGGEPPVIVAASTNNQAVTNIIDSFGKAQEKTGGSRLGARWLPGLSSYGLYCVSPARNDRDGIKKYQLAFPNGDGFLNDLENADYLNRASVDFVIKSGEALGLSVKNVAHAVQLLHDELTRLVRSLQEGLNLWLRLNRQRQEIESKYGPSGGIDPFIETKTQKWNEAQIRVQEARERKISWFRHLEKEPFWMGFCLDQFGQILSGIFDWVRERRRLRNDRFLTEVGWEATCDIADNATIARNCHQQVLDRDSECRALLGPLEDARKGKAALLEIRALWDQWATHSKVNVEDPNNDLDLVFRSSAFQWATHYWEGRWLLDVEKIINAPPGPARREESPEIKWRRYAKLTPCFVSTLFMAPRFWGDCKKADGTPFEYIDLMIVDEAGQVSPDIGGASFALARKALVVGDTLQIEPVWAIPKKIDEGNMRRYGICSDVKSMDEFRQKGLSAYLGCLMTVAQRQSRYQKIEGMRGMFLSEHRRCLREIIEICNRLAYRGMLRSMREPITGHPLPPLGYAHIPGETRAVRGSYENEIEADVIADWVREKLDALKSYYESAQQKSIENLVGVITPFSSQAELIRRKLRDRNVKGVTVGTVHTLQGAERPVIIFSPTYSQNARGRFFFDRSVNMLNVAISRAKDSFLIFGNMDIFDVGNLGLPSSFVAHAVLTRENSEITDIRLPERKIFRPGTSVNRLDTLEAHQAMLFRCFEEAQKRLFIVSPYISSDAIQSDGLPDRIKSALKRGVSVTFVIDRTVNRDVNGQERPRAVLGQEILRNSGATLLVVPKFHNKILCMDDDRIVEGSFNWLSAARSPDSPYFRSDSSLCYQGTDEVKVLISKAIQDIEKRLQSRVDQTGL
jgi:hypothetical protein